jgi:hypothetical protein
MVAPGRRAKLTWVNFLTGSQTPLDLGQQGIDFPGAEWTLSG